MIGTGGGLAQGPAGLGDAAEPDPSGALVEMPACSRRPRATGRPGTARPGGVGPGTVPRAGEEDQLTCHGSSMRTPCVSLLAVLR